MKLTIDTKHDTHDDIRKVLHILTHILEKKEGSVDLDSERLNSASSNSEPSDTGNLMSMFANPGEKKEPETDTAPDFSGFMNLVNKKEEDENEEPKLQFF
ncbi:hypothetical protein HON71_05165 [Candidatus Woesearchaeota archaeon]|jgi:hypothetical protein|nr:hypothetical protein [Candidatus Woesearchaeota archaeon]MBT5342091.1 hypothetical protein [Candidatus Woesearchaeota archaeon]MBT6773950.1 hypothetical protein [Candidatus Woesearchaeota archaeon]